MGNLAHVANWIGVFNLVHLMWFSPVASQPAQPSGRYILVEILNGKKQHVIIIYCVGALLMPQVETIWKNLIFVLSVGQTIEAQPQKNTPEYLQWLYDQPMAPQKAGVRSIGREFQNIE